MRIDFGFRRGIAEAFALAIIALMVVAPAFAQTGTVKSPTVLNLEVNTLFPDQTTGAVTPFDARQTFLDVVASYPNLAGGATTAQQLATALAGGNNNAPTINLYNSVDISHATDFGVPLMQIISEGTRNAFVAQGIQDQPTLSFLTAVTGYGRINAGGDGNYVYALFGKVSVNTANGSATNEVDCENLVADSPNTFPYNLGFPVSGAYCVGLQAANIGAKKGHTAFYSVADSAPWRVSFYAAPTTIDATNPTSDIAGIWIDATATKSPVNSAIFKNSGLSSNIPVIIQTLGALNASQAVLQLQNIAGASIWEVDQNGVTQGTGNIVLTQTLVGAASVATTNNDTGSTSSARLIATSNAGTISLQAISTAGASGGVLRWTGAGAFLIDAQNAMGNISVRTGATPTAALNISAAGILQVPLIATGTPAASVCIDASNNIIKKTTTGPCV